MCHKHLHPCSQGVFPGVTTTELDTLAAETAAYMSTQHPDFSVLAARLSVSNLHKQTKKSFSETINDLRNYVHPVRWPAQLIAEDVHAIIQENKATLDSAIVYDRDFSYDYLGLRRSSVRTF